MLVAPPRVWLSDLWEEGWGGLRHTAHEEQRQTAALRRLADLSYCITFLTQALAHELINEQWSDVVIPNCDRWSCISFPRFFLFDQFTVPDSVTQIGCKAFTWNQLPKACILDSLTLIGEYAFSYNNIPDLRPGEYVAVIVIYAFFNHALTRVDITNSAVFTGTNAFHQNRHFSAVIISSLHLWIHLHPYVHRRNYYPRWAFTDNSRHRWRWIWRWSD